jgi:tetratricopeptide (TPR) repeat protein
MRWLFSEFILKGIYLGLLLFVALKAPPDWQATGQVAALTVGGFLIGLGIAAAGKLREGYTVKGRLPAFILFLLLESPRLIYAGLILGLTAGAFSVLQSTDNSWLSACVGGGAALGVVFWLLRHLANKWLRLGLCLTLAIALVGGALASYHYFNELFQDPEVLTMFGVRLLLGIPLFYLLTFAGLAEESEVEIAAICAALGLGAWTLVRDWTTYQSFALLIPLVIYFVYTTRILNGLRVFKHVVRGLSFAKIGRYRPALLSFRRALQLDPHNHLARESMWAMHRAMNLDEVVKDPQTLELMDLDLCLERATSLLMQPGPSAEKLQEAQRLLGLVLSQRPALLPAVNYWRAVAFTHARNYEKAATELQNVLDPKAFAPGDPSRAAVLFPAWQLALTLHPELQRRVGTPQLAQPGRRLEAIAAVERCLAANPEDAAGWELKRILYSSVSEADYREATGGDRAAADFDHAYVLQLGMALIGDPARWERGVEYLRMAARGLLDQGPTIFMCIAQAHQRMGKPDGVWDYYELAKRAGRAVGPKNLGEADRQAYFAAVKLLAENARTHDDFDTAIENYQLYAESDRSGLETLRTLADLHERKGDALGAARVNDQALLYNPKDKDLLERKDRYYYSVMPEQLRAKLETTGKGFDVDYCLRKARSLLDFKNADLDLVDWAQHLAELAQVVKPDSLAARVLRARALRRRGEIDQSQALLEEVYQQKSESFASGEEEDAWYLACRLLGEMYLYDLGKPDLAVPCFTAYRKSSKSGADTIYKLGQAYEQLGDRVRAAKYYENVTAYESHPLAMDARDALHRLQSG